MKKKLIGIVSIGVLLTFIIYKNFHYETMRIVGLGDGLALGQTAYEVQGYGYNDYLRDFYEKNSILEEYITEFININETSETLKIKIGNNYGIESMNITIQQAISKAKILTLSIGMIELNIKNELKSKDIENYLNNMEKILHLLRIYNEKKIFLISLYPSKKISKEKIRSINQSLEEICKKNNIIFINIEDINTHQEFFFNEKSFYLNYKGHRYISEKIIEKMSS